ncbi:glycosyltransferase family 2 protein [Treponema primitia]|uniref:glycosyltransferase family 2 protein n=1 Tax=Treponema primitia TaxID=88058 RepID=UPI0002554D61|nr:glycosyltransferase family 2 protein [Treponema primitia]
MKISIVTVCYNSVITMRNTIKSALSQVDVNLEYIIVDGASVDGTLDIIKEYAEKYPKIIKYISSPDAGIYDAMNKGIEIATGTIIGILNSDDCYSANDVLYFISREFDKTGSDAVYGDLLYVKNNKPYRYWKSGERKSFKSGWMIPHPSFFVKKEIYIKYGNFRLDCGSAADYEILLRLLEKYSISISYLPKVLVYMRIGGVSNSGIKSRINALIEDKHAWEVNSLEPLKFTIFLKKIYKLSQFIRAKTYKSPCNPSLLSVDNFSGY